MRKFDSDIDIKLSLSGPLYKHEAEGRPIEDLLHIANRSVQQAMRDLEVLGLHRRVHSCLHGKDLAKNRLHLESRVRHLGLVLLILLKLDAMLV